MNFYFRLVVFYYIYAGPFDFHQMTVMMTVLYYLLLFGVIHIYIYIYTCIVFIRRWFGDTDDDNDYIDDATSQKQTNKQARFNSNERYIKCLKTWNYYRDEPIQLSSIQKICRYITKTTTKAYTACCCWIPGLIHAYIHTYESFLVVEDERIACYSTKWDAHVIVR